MLFLPGDAQPAADRKTEGLQNGGDFSNAAEAESEGVDTAISQSRAWMANGMGGCCTATAQGHLWRSFWTSTLAHVRCRQPPIVRGRQVFRDDVARERCLAGNRARAPHAMAGKIDPACVVEAIEMACP